METPSQRVAILRREVADFKQRLAHLPPGAWGQPSACAGWTVAEVMGHLAGQDFALRVRRGIAGDYSPPPGSPPVSQHDEDAFAQAIFERAFATREREGMELAATLLRRLDETVAVFESVPADGWDALCYWPPGPEPARVMLDMRISELSMHAWDIFSGLDPEYRLSPAAIAVLTDTIPRAVRRAFRPDPGLTAPLRFRFDLTEPAAAAYDLIFSRESVALERAATEPPPAVTFRCGGETYVMVMYGRLEPAAALAAGRLSYSGDAALAESFGGRFVGG